MRALTPRARLHGEQGASLALILALIAILGLCVGGIAVQGTAGMMAVKGVSNQRSDVYGAEGAIDAAINHIRDDLTRGRPGTEKCAQPATASPPVIFTGPSDFGDVTVTCRVFENGWGIPVSGANYPAYAILTTGGLPDYPEVDQVSACGDDPGICLEGNASGRVEVDGAVYSNAENTSRPSINSPNGVKLDAGKDAVLARGTCNPPTAIIAIPRACQTSNPDKVVDPGGAYNVDPPAGHPWASEIQSMPPQAPQPTCNTTTKVATMVPGSYFNHYEMISGFSNPPGNSTSATRCTVVWMQPGNYYFDFEEPTLGDDWPLWRIGHDDNNRGGGINSAGRVVIGGVRKGWDNTTQASAVIENVPGACDTTQSGVQAVFAGNSTFDIKHEGRLELCPPVYPSDPNRQLISIYGRKSNQTASSTSVVFKPTSANTATPASFGTPLANLISIDSLVTTGTQTGSNKTNALTLTGYGPTAAMQPVGTFNSAVLTVKHSEVTVPVNVATIKATITRGNGTTDSNCVTTTAFTRQTVLTSQSWTIPPACIDSIAELTGATVKWEVTNPNSSGTPSVTSTLDGAELTATYTPVPMRKKADAGQIVWMYGAWPTSVLSERQPEIYIWGTVYAPTSRIDLNFGDVSTTKAQFKRGVVIAGIKVNQLRSDQDEPAFANPFPTRYTDRYVELIASIGGDRQLRAVVRLTDDDPSTPGREIRIISWNAVN